MVLKHRFCPEHLNTDIFLNVYGGVKEERMQAKAAGDKLKDATLKLSINGSFGMFGNRYSWLFDHKVRLQICVNGQLMLAMLIEELMLEGIQIIDANTDGVYVYVHKSKKLRYEEIVKEWEKTTLMEMEHTKFESLWFVNTADYFGTYKAWDKKLAKEVVKVKEKGMFQSEVQLGKGMEFPIVAKSIKDYFLKGVPFEQTIKSSENILDFCSYKKLSRDTECWHGGVKGQKTNRFYACISGAYLYRRSRNAETGKWGNMEHLLKESPVILYNKFDDKPISQRRINYGFYMAAARAAIYAIEGQPKLF